MTLRFAYRSTDGGICYVEAAPRERLALVIGEPVADEETGEITAYRLTEQAYRAHVIERSIPPDAEDVTEIPPDHVLPDRAGRNEAWLQSLRGKK